MIDISMQGAKITLQCSAISAGNIVLEFSDEGTPIEIPDIEVASSAMTMNGELVTWTKPNPINFSITVIPGSASDNALRNLLYAGHVGGRKGKAINQEYVHIDTATLEVPNIYTNGIVTQAKNLKFVFANGRLTAGPMGIGSNAEGKMSPRTYKFVFESASYQ